MGSHGLNIENGGIRAESFTYGWCLCGWTHEERPSAWSRDRIKKAFLAHLKAQPNERALPRPNALRRLSPNAARQSPDGIEP